MKTARKTKEAPPPGRFLRSKSGTYARLIKTTQTRDGLWLYRLAYDGGHTKGTRLWTLPEIQLWAHKWLTRAPRGWSR